jgi:hypothetical protein
MDRLSRVMAVGSLAIVLGTVLISSGCRSMRSEVPPGKPYSTTGGQPPTVGFSSDPRPSTGAGAGMYGGGLTPGATGPDGNQSVAPSNGMPQFGTPAPNPGNYGAPTANKYGPMGSAGTGP